MPIVVYVPRGEALRREPEKCCGMFAFKPATGEIVWQTPAPRPECLGRRGCSNARKSPPTAIPGTVFSPSMGAHIRACDTTNGKIIWDFNALRILRQVPHNFSSRHVRLPERRCLRSEGNLQRKPKSPPFIQGVRDLPEVIFADVEAGLGKLWVI